MQWVGALKTEETVGQERYAHRHSLSLVAQASTEANDTARVVIHNLSNTGVLIEADLPLGLGDDIAVELPHAGVQHATVAWSSGGYHGCEFETTISEAAVSAARLRSMPVWQPEPEAKASDVRPFLPAMRNAPAGRLSIRSKVLILTGLTASCWAAIGGAGLLVLGLI